MLRSAFPFVLALPRRRVPTRGRLGMSTLVRLAAALFIAKAAFKLLRAIGKMLVSAVLIGLVVYALTNFL